MKLKTKTIRFKEYEIEQIEKFLDKNPALDFSTLVRLATNQFIGEPKLISIKTNFLNLTDKKNKDIEEWT